MSDQKEIHFKKMTDDLKELHYYYYKNAKNRMPFYKDMNTLVQDYGPYPQPVNDAQAH